MLQSCEQNRRIVLAGRPHGLPTLQDFRLEQAPVPEVQEGQVLLRSMYLSLDPYMRQIMDEVAPVYASSVPLGEVMPGGTVSRIVVSRNQNYQAGDVVLSNVGWQEFSVSDGQDLLPIDDLGRPWMALAGLGMPAFTAYVGLLDIGEPMPGETLVVAAATGAVGSVVGQIAKIKGMRVVGVAGGSEKCRYAVTELGFDACLDRHDPQFAEQLALSCPNGVDIYFENVGGIVFDAVLPLLNVNARIPVIGHIADYNANGLPSGPNRVPLLMASILQKRIRMQGLVILDHYANRLDAFRRDMKEWVSSGRVKTCEDLVVGLENTPAAFIGLLEGRNFGKLMIRLTEQ